MDNQLLFKEYKDILAILNRTGYSTHDKGRKLAIYLEEMITEMGKLIKLFSSMNELIVVLHIFSGKRTLNNNETNKKYKNLLDALEAIKNPPKKPSKKPPSNAEPSTSKASTEETEAAAKQLDPGKILNEIFADVHSNWNVRKF